MYIRLIDSTLRENEYLFRLNDQQKAYYFELILAARINYHLTSGFKEQLLWSTGKYALQV